MALHKSRPFLVSLHEIHLDGEAFAEAAVQCEALFDTYKQCMKTGLWAGYPEEPQPVQLPAQRHEHAPEQELVEEGF